MWDFLNEWLFKVDQEQDIEKFLKKNPEIDIRQIVEKVSIFNYILQERDLEKLNKSILLLDDNIKKNVRQSVVLGNFLGTYSFRSIFPLNKCIDLLQDDTVKVYMRYKKRYLRGGGYFYYYLIFKQVEDDWVIVKSNLYNKLQWREWGILFYLLLFFVFIFISEVRKLEKSRRQPHSQTDVSTIEKVPINR